MKKIEDTMFRRLLQLPLFQGMGEEALLQILEKTKMSFSTHPAGEIIARAGMQCEGLLFVLGGTLCSVTVQEEQEFVLEEEIETPSLIEPFSLFGKKTTFTATYKAQTDVQLLSIEKSYIVSYLNTYEIFQINYLNTLSNRAQQLHARLWDTYSADITQKIVHFLALRSNGYMGRKVLHIKMKQLAKLIHETRINVSNVLNHLETLHLLELSRKTIIIPDMQALIHYIHL